MKNISTFKVSVALPAGVTAAEMTNYIRDSVSTMKGSYPPDEPIFDLDSRSVKVTSAAKKRTKLKRVLKRAIKEIDDNRPLIYGFLEERGVDEKICSQAQDFLSDWATVFLSLYEEVLSDSADELDEVLFSVEESATAIRDRLDDILSGT